MLTTFVILAIIGSFSGGAAELLGTTQHANVKSSRSSRQRRLVGGNKTPIEAHPYQVSLELLGVHVCGGAIVNEEWIVTASHCFRYSWTEVTVRAGTSTIMKGGSTHQVIEIIPYDKQQQFGSEINDIALVRVSPPMRLDKTRRKVELPRNSSDTLKPGVMANVTGWGLTDHGPTGDLYVLELPIFSKNICQDLYLPLVGPLHEGQMCAGFYGKTGKGSCAADGGGPLMFGPKLIGIVSWGRSCGSPYYPGVYSDVAHYSDWIVKKVNGTKQPVMSSVGQYVYNTTSGDKVADVAMKIQLL